MYLDRQNKNLVTNLSSLFMCLAMVTAFSASAAPKAPAKTQCASLLDGIGDHTDVDLAKKMNVFPISSLWSSDPLQNIAIQHPSVLMRAAQRLLHIAESQGSRVINVANIGPVKVYNLFSVPNEVNEGRVIIGHHQEIADYANLLTGAATRNQRKAPILQGPSGTGKSEFIEIYRLAMNNLSRSNPEFASFTFRWKNLDMIPELQTFAEANSGGFTSQTNESPFVLLPTEMQKTLLNFANSQESLTRITDIVGALNPVTSPDPQSSYIQTQLYAFYTNKKRQNLGDPGAQLNIQEMLAVLEDHVDVVQVELGRPENTPILDKEGPDFKQGELFVQKDPLLAATLPGRFRNPLAWVYGKIPSANGMPLFLDEFPRNTDKLQDMFLRLLESGQIVLGAAPVINVDTFITLAGNLESLEKLAEAGGTKAQRDRVALINFGWSTYPYEVAKLMLLMQGQVFMQDLNDPAAEVVRADLEKLFPLPLAGRPVETTDGRYRIFIGSGKHRVHVNPRTLINMAMIVASTRISLDAKKAQEVAGNMITIQNPSFRLPSHRMKIYMGQTPVPAAEEADLQKLSILLKEGHSGMSTRDANNWLSASISRASAYNNGELTPAIVRDVLLEKLADQSIDFGGDHKVRSKWIHIANMINEEILVPDLEQDVMRAQAADMLDVTRLHDQVILELSAISQGESSYRHPETGRETQVNFKRLDGIKAKFREQQRRDLDPNTLASFMLAMQTSQGSKLYEPLKDAILSYLSEKHSESVGLLQLVEYGQSKDGDGEVRAVYNSLIKGMNALGYSETGALDAISLVEQSRQRQRERSQQQR